MIRPRDFRSLRKGIWVSASLVCVFAASEAEAWYDHTAVMSWVSKRLEEEVPSPRGAPSWTSSLPDGRYQYSQLASVLLLNPKGELPSLKAKNARELLSLSAEDPDHGMDRDLPDTADPSDDRKYMGGSTGGSSSGFRHMFWPGWKIRKPIATFQIPPRPLGQSPDRIELFANEARAHLKNNDFEWGLRLLGWAIHYIQDLTQPFHAAQVPSLRMVPWTSFAAWPPSRSFPSLVKETTRTITNYHWAYEGYVRHALLQGDQSPFRRCFEAPGEKLEAKSPRELALEIIERSISRSRKTGKDLMGLVGSHLKDSGISVPLNPAQVNNEDLLRNPNLADPREDLNRTTCESLRLATDSTIWIVKWALASEK